MLRYARIKASCDSSKASSRLPTRPSAIEYAFFIYILTMVSNASFDPLRAGSVKTNSFSQTLLTVSGSKTSGYDSNAGFNVSFYINIHHKEPIYSIYFFGVHIVTG
jgi:hypothetical protein